jgi:hypothetical protein
MEITWDEQQTTMPIAYVCVFVLGSVYSKLIITMSMRKIKKSVELLHMSKIAKINCENRSGPVVEI